MKHETDYGFDSTGIPTEEERDQQARSWIQHQVKDLMRYALLPKKEIAVELRAIAAELEAQV